MLDLQFAISFTLFLLELRKQYVCEKSRTTLRSQEVVIGITINDIGNLKDLIRGCQEKILSEKSPPVKSQG